MGANEVSRSVQDAVLGVNEITHSITGLAEATRVIAKASEESRQTAESLASLSQQLNAEVGRFRV